MTTAADDAADEIAFEAFLAGRIVPDGADGSSPAVAAFAGAVRATATLPGRPSAALAELLATGLLTDQSSPSIRTAPSAGGSPRRSRVRRRRRFAMFFPALIAKFLSLGAVAQAASGAGIALVAFTGAGAVGVLPGSVQDSFTSVVSSQPTAQDTTLPADPTATETGGATATATGDGTAVQTPAVVTPAAPTTTPLTLQAWKKGPAAGQSFGDWVSSGARLGYADGATISKFAHAKNEDRKAAGTAAPTASHDDESDDSGRDGSETETAKTGSGDHGDSGHGDSGHGNSGHGHN